MGGAISVALTVAMVIGIFAGTGMDVRASETVAYDKLTAWQHLKNGTIVTHSNNVDVFYCKSKEAITKWVNSGEGGGVANPEICSLKKTLSVTIGKDNDLTGEWENRDWHTYNNALLNNEVETPVLYLYPCDCPEPSPSNEEKNEEKGNTPHTHSYSWVTVQDVTAEQDGVEEYRCSCGDVQERCILPRYMAIVKGLYGAVKDAPQNGTATFDTGSAFTMTDYVIRKLSERTDVTTVITFKYQNQAYRMTIPAGADYTALLSDGDYFYGYFYFANAVGATIEAM